MDWRFLFISMDGRIGRKQFWIASIILIVASIVVSLLVGGALGASMLNAMSGEFMSPEAVMGFSSTSGWTSLIVFAIFVMPFVSVMIKRRHDRGSAGTEVWAYMGLSGLMFVLQGLNIGYEAVDLLDTGVYFAQPNMLITVLSLVSLALGLYLLVVCGFLKGDPETNAYGPDPLSGE